MMQLISASVGWNPLLDDDEPVLPVLEKAEPMAARLFFSWASSEADDPPEVVVVSAAAVVVVAFAGAVVVAFDDESELLFFEQPLKTSMDTSTTAIALVRIGCLLGRPAPFMSASVRRPA
jgi:hypothetical protein